MLQKSARVDFLPAGTRTAQGEITRHEVTSRSLGRLVVEQQGRYPDLETWVAVLRKRALDVMLYSYDERLTSTGVIGRLWLYYKHPDAGRRQALEEK